MPTDWPRLLNVEIARHLRADADRLWRLVRHQRKALFVAGLITTAEYVALNDDEDRALDALEAVPPTLT